MFNACILTNQKYSAKMPLASYKEVIILTKRKEKEIEIEERCKREKNLNNLQEMQKFLEFIGDQKNIAIIMALYEEPSSWVSADEIRKIIHKKYGAPFINEDNINALKKYLVISDTFHRPEGKEIKKIVKFKLIDYAKEMIDCCIIML